MRVARNEATKRKQTDHGRCMSRRRSVAKHGGWELERKSEFVK